MLKFLSAYKKSNPNFLKKLIRITTIPLSLEKLLEGQLTYMNSFFEVTAVAAEKERLEKYGKDNGVNTFYVDLTREITPFKDLRAVWKLYSYFRKEKPQIVHSHTPKAGIVGMFAAWLARVPIRLHTVAGLPLMETTGFKRKILNWVEKATYFFATRVYPNSKGLYEIIIDEGFAKPSKLKVLGKGSSNGIDTNYFDPSQYSAEFKADFRNSLEIPKEHLVYIFIGRLVSEKGINELIKAFEKLYQQNNSIKLLLVGPFEQELDPLDISTIETINNHPGVISVGYQVDVRPYLAISDILTFPSYREGFPNVVMQAASMGLPVIVTNINGCNEIVKHNYNGLIIPPKNTSSLHENMELLSTNNALKAKLGTNSRKEVTANYERKEFWEGLLKEYRELEHSVE